MYFIELFKFKSSEKFNIIFIEEVEDEIFLVFFMFFVFFIENVFKYSGIEKRGISFVNIYFKLEEDIIEFLVENSFLFEMFVNDE